VRTLRSAGRDTKPAAVLVLANGVAAATATGVFDRVIAYEPKRHIPDGLDALTRTDHERFNILPRLRGRALHCSTFQLSTFQQFYQQFYQHFSALLSPFYH